MQNTALTRKGINASSLKNRKVYSHIEWLSFPGNNPKKIISMDIHINPGYIIRMDLQSLIEWHLPLHHISMVKIYTPF